MYTLDYTGQFKKDLKKVSKQGLPLDLLQEVLDQLEANGQVEEKYKPHILHGITSRAPVSGKTALS